MTCFTQNLLIKCKSHLKSSRLAFDQISGHYGPAKLTHKMNHRHGDDDHGRDNSADDDNQRLEEKAEKQETPLMVPILADLQTSFIPLLLIQHSHSGVSEDTRRGSPDGANCEEPTCQCRRQKR